MEMTLRVVLLLPRGWQSVGWSPVMVLSGPVLKGSRVFSLEGQNCIFFCDLTIVSSVSCLHSGRAVRDLRALEPHPSPPSTAWRLFLFP